MQIIARDFIDPNIFHLYSKDKYLDFYKYSASLYVDSISDIFGTFILQACRDLVPGTRIFLTINGELLEEDEDQ